MTKLSASDFDMANATTIGVGALATVYRVRHIPSNALVVSKSFFKKQLLQQQKLDAVKREKSILTRITPHPHVVRFYGSAQSEDELYLFMEEMTRGDLQEHIQRVRLGHIDRFMAAAASKASENKSKVISSCAPWIPGLFCLSFSDVQLITAQLVDVLEFLHVKIGEEGRHPTVMLRDLKSENIAFDAAGRAVLIDFDTAEETVNVVPVSNNDDPLHRRHPSSDNASKSRRMTISGIQEMRKMSILNFVGTAQFMSPELLGSVLATSYASDLWALGVVIYQCVFGRYPFDGPTPFSIMSQLLKGLEPWRHFPPYSAASSTMSPPVATAAEEGSSGTDTANASSPAPPRYTFEEYITTCDLIRQLLRIDPAKRLGVDNGFHGSYDARHAAVPVNTGCKPNYALLRCHEFFRIKGCQYVEDSDIPSSSSSLSSSFNWNALRAHCGEGHTDSDPATSDQFVPLSKLSGEKQQQLNAEAATSPLLSSYQDLPFHSQKYCSHETDYCSAGSPLEGFFLRQLDETSDSTTGGDANTNHNGEGTEDEEEEVEECPEKKRGRLVLSARQFEIDIREVNEKLSYAASQDTAGANCISSLRDDGEFDDLFLRMAGRDSEVAHRDTLCLFWAQRHFTQSMQHFQNEIAQIESELHERHLQEEQTPESVHVGSVQKELAQIEREENDADDTDYVVDDVSGHPGRSAISERFSKNTHVDFR